MFEPSTPTELYFWGEVLSYLGDESIETCAYLVPRVGRKVEPTYPNRAAFVAITATRVIFIETRVGVRAPLLENRGGRVIERGAIVGAGIIRGKLLAIEDSSAGILVYQVKRDPRWVTTQSEFFDLVTRWWPRTPAIDAAERGPLPGRPTVPQAVARVKRD
jgi:hypothetical protein